MCSKDKWKKNHLFHLLFFLQNISRKIMAISLILSCISLSIILNQSGFSLPQIQSSSSSNSTSSSEQKNIIKGSDMKINKFNPRVIMLNFFDNPKSQFLNAKPILDKYGFKGTFFVVCDWIGSNKSYIPRMTWDDVKTLYDQGHAIESHSMDHKDLYDLPINYLTYEITQSKICLQDHGINATIFAPPHESSWDDIASIKIIAQNYDFAVGGFKIPMYLDCHGWELNTIIRNQSDCRTFSGDGQLNFANRYDIKGLSHNKLDERYYNNASEIYNNFVRIVNDAVNLNNNGHITAIPIINYHSFENNKPIDNTLPFIFSLEMKYLHDNNFKVLKMTDWTYNSNNNTLGIKYEQ